jgi:hypothetical protein
MSHHLSGPDLRSPKDDPRLDMTDLFVFPAKTEGRTAIILDVNPDPANAPGLHPDAVYQVHIDTDGDLRPDITYHFTASELDDAGQTVSVLQARGAEAGSLEPVGRTLADGLVVGLSGEVTEDTSEGHRIAVALRSDPFFADLEGIIDHFNFTGRDAMAEANVYGLVLEVPDSELGDGPIGVWARVALEGNDSWESIDRGANPSVTAYFNQENDEKIAYNQGTPATDEADHLDRFVGVLEHLSNWETDKARETLLATIVPDTLRWDRGQPTAYPNGRALTDDVTSARLAMITNGQVTSDNIPPHTDLQDDFPYLGEPHAAVSRDSFPDA